jgi:hypothetical protein
MNRILVLIILLLLVSKINAQDEIDSSEVGEVHYVLYPMGFYTPETNFALGGGGLFYARLGIRKKLLPSKVRFAAYYTLNNQYSFSIEPSIYFKGTAKVVSESKFIFNKEIYKFYGIGNDTKEIEAPEYTIQYTRLYTELGYETRFIDEFHFGIIYEFTKNDILSFGDNPILKEGKIDGIYDGNTSGFGFVFIWDKRDNVFYPTKNGYYKLRTIFNGAEWGSDFTYKRVVGDLRKYTNLGNENIIATQVYFESTIGDVPFYKLPALGGRNRMRGYFLGRYRDKTYFTTQIEYRKIFWKRIGFVLFAGFGDVASAYNKFELEKLKYSFGGGLRYVFDEQERLNVRMDIGFGKGTSGIYFSLEEAF